MMAYQQPYGSGTIGVDWAQERSSHTVVLASDNTGKYATVQNTLPNYRLPTDCVQTSNRKERRAAAALARRASKRRK